MRIGSPPSGTNLGDVARAVNYTGSVYHKDIPSFAGKVPRPRPDANICPRALAWQQERITQWLRDAILNGWFSEVWSKGLPTRVWIRRDGVIYEARPTNAGNGEYHGYPLDADQDVKDLP